MKKALPVGVSAWVMTLVLVIGLLGIPMVAAAAPGPVVNLKLGHVDGENTNLHVCLVNIGTLVKERSGGQFTIDVSGASQLGGDRDLVESMQMGTVAMASVGTSIMSNFVKEFAVYDAPFLYRSDQHAFNVADGEIGQALNQKMLAQDVRILGYMGTGFRNIFANKPVATIDDIKGIKIRLMENAIQVAAFEALGALPTTMAYSELFTAIQQGTIDAAESGMKNILDMKFNEVAQYISQTQHFYLLKPVCISESIWQTLPAEYQQMLQAAVTESIAQQRQETITENAQAVKDLVSQGATVYTDFDFSELSRRVAPIYEQNHDYLPPDLIAQIQGTDG